MMMKQVLQAVQTEWKRCEGAASQYTAVEYITAAIEFAVFEQLVMDHLAMEEYECA